MGERLKLLRKDLKLTQAKFGKRIMLSQNFIAVVESGQRELSERSIRDICAEFGVNEEWLRTGIGEMYASPKTDNDILSGKLLDAYKSSPEIVRSIVDTYMDLDDDNKQAFARFWSSISDRLHSGTGVDTRVITEEMLKASIVPESEEA